MEEGGGTVSVSAGAGAITGYQVRWCKSSTCTAWTTEAKTVLTAKIAGRTKGVSYRVEVKAKNSFKVSGTLRIFWGPVASKTFTQGR
ncbi:MAG: hypothetical protein NTZ03_16380 [Actinobacteria bacterium]|nr:hypothetical protein [Actinomycetota bacterium]